MRIYFDLEHLLEKKKVSKTKLCKYCDLQRTQLNNYCKNKTGGISLEVMARICTYLECTPNDIFRMEED